MKNRANHLPPLPALRAFEAVARLGSVSRAAEEMNVTKGAVSHQIRSLEEDIGAPLLRRGRRDQQAEPTDLGMSFLRSVRASLGLLEAACRDSRVAASGGSRRKLSISANASFASLWIIPRLGRFLEQRPDVDVEVHLHTNQTPRWKNQDIDLAFLHVHDRGARLSQPDDIALFTEVIVPVCSPVLLKRTRPDDLELFTRHRLISEKHVASPETSWSLWLNRLGIAKTETREQLILHGMGAVVAAAVAGAGIALGRSPLIDEDIAAHRLVELMPGLKLDGLWRYVIRLRPDRAADEAVGAFVEYCQRESTSSG
jgi:LysR family transcriptional regulator, glycine cleavage system transcriptional activator